MAAIVARAIGLQDGGVPGLRLLIVDDSAQMRRLLRAVVDDIATEIRECSGGAEAVDLYFEMHPDWVLMDLQMADGDGLRATHEICRRDRAARVMVVTQFDQEEFRSAAAEMGATAYVLKENLLGIRRLLLSSRA